MILKTRENCLLCTAAAVSLMGLSQVSYSQTVVVGTIDAGFVHGQIQIIIRNASPNDILGSYLTGTMLEGPMIGLEDTSQIGTISAHSNLVIGYGSPIFVPFGSTTHNNPSSDPNLDYNFGIEFIGAANNSLYLSHFSPSENITGNYIDFEHVQDHRGFAPVQVAQILDPVITPEAGSIASMFAFCVAGASLLIRRRR